jgi:hypothetical protein
LRVGRGLRPELCESRMSDSVVPIVGRDRELDALNRLSDALLRGESRTLIIHGDAGIGKTTILERFIATETSCQIKTCAGVESEMELPWAALHQLCAPILDSLSRIPAPQSAALKAAFGMAEDGMPDPLLCGMAVLSLLTDLAEKRPLVCVIDDAYALDQASLKTLGFVSRRLHAESVGLVFAVRQIPPDLSGIPDLPVRALAAVDAGQLLDAAVHAPLDPAVRERVIAETGGNPLAILELAEQGHFRQLAGGYDVPRSVSLAGRIEESFLQTAQALDPDTQTVLLLAAADPTGDAALLHRAALASGVRLPERNDQPVHRLISLVPSVRFPPSAGAVRDLRCGLRCRPASCAPHARGGVCPWRRPRSARVAHRPVARWSGRASRGRARAVRRERAGAVRALNVPAKALLLPRGGMPPMSRVSREITAVSGLKPDRR